ncbi:MAG: WD40 repeat domain-containing protein, partial [Cytophagales bacterium]
GFSDFNIRTYSLADFSLQKEWTAHTNSIFSLQFTPDNKHLVSASRDAYIKIWDIWNHFELEQSIVAHLYAINSVAFSPNGKYFATGSMDKTVKIWDASEWKLLKVLDKSRHAGHATSVNKVIWLDDEKLISGSDDKMLSLWELSDEN